jgi:large repetitive protein
LDAGTGLADASWCGVGGVSHVTLALTNQYATSAELVWNGSNYAANWHERPQAGTPPWNIFFGFVSGGGQALGSKQLISTGNGIGYISGLAAWTGEEYGIVYTENTVGAPYYQDLFSRVDATGTPVAQSEIPIHPDSEIQNNPAVAWNPLDGEFGVTWTEGTSSPTLYFARIRTGAVVSAAAIRACTGASLSDSGSHMLVWTGTQYALTWSEGDTVYMGEVSRTGQLSAASVTPLGLGVVAPMESNVAFDGTQYGVVWADYRTNTYQVHFARANAGGGYVAGSDALVGSPNMYSAQPDIVWNGTDFVAVWTEHAATAPPSVIRLARFTSTGAIVSSGAETLTCSGDTDWLPMISWNGMQHAVSYARLFGCPQQSEQNLLLIP